MNQKSKLILLQLERSRYCFAAAIKRAEATKGGKPLEDWASVDAPAIYSSANDHGMDLQACTTAAGLEVIRDQLRRARRAADAVASQVERGCALDNTAAEAADALMFLAAAVTTPRQQVLVTEAAAAHAVLTRLSLTIAQQQQHAALDATKRASSTEDRIAAASAADQAQEAIGLAMWAARIGGCDPQQNTQKMASFNLYALQSAIAAAAAAAETSAASDAPTAPAEGRPQFHSLEPLQKQPRLEAPSAWVSGQPYCSRPHQSSSP